MMNLLTDLEQFYGKHWSQILY